MTAPLRKVVHANVRVMSSILASFKTYRWFFELECGHEVDRPIKYLPQPEGEIKRRGFAALWHPPEHSRIPPPPKRARCDECARKGGLNA